MTLHGEDLLEEKVGKQLYDYQHDAIAEIFKRIDEHPEGYNLLYQLPTGGGKTVIFSEIAKRYIKSTGKKVMILTHRIELCGQTSHMLDEFGVKNKIINSKVKELPDVNEYGCFVAMVETLNNRLNDEAIKIDDLGLVIVDEAHYNSFRKLFKFFDSQILLGVTATPLSSNIELPMKDNYRELIVGDSIPSLIDKGFLAKATTFTYDVNLGGLKIGVNGDYTVSSSEIIYNRYLMQDKLVQAYEERAKGKKTLIFNNGINTSKNVFALFTKAGYDIRHLDNTNSEQERREILDWFHTTKNGILTSVSILTTGFDEPGVESIILNRATRSLTLYHQMIGRGSRVLPDKKEFAVIDLGNNAHRFGLWDEPVNWQRIFQHPMAYLENLRSDEDIEMHFTYELPDRLKEKLKNSTDLNYDIEAVYDKILREGGRSMKAIDLGIAQHAKICCENSEDQWDAYELGDELDDEIRFRIKKYSYLICKNTDNYLEWLFTEYKRKLKQAIRTEFA